MKKLPPVKPYKKRNGKSRPWELPKNDETEWTPEETFPNDLRERADFQQIFTRFQTGRVDYGLELAITRDLDHRTDDDVQSVAAWIGKTGLLGSLGPKIHQDLARTAALLEVPAGSPFFQQGDDASEFYAIFSGEVAVEVDGRRMASLGPGDTFGDKALESDEPRSATIRAIVPTRALVIHKAHYLKAVASRRRVLAQEAMAVLASGFGASWPQSRALLAVALLTRREYPCGGCIFAAGDDATALFVVASGEVTLRVSFEHVVEHRWPATAAPAAEVVAAAARRKRRRRKRQGVGRSETSGIGCGVVASCISAAVGGSGGGGGWAGGDELDGSSGRRVSAANACASEAGEDNPRSRGQANKSSPRTEKAEEAEITAGSVELIAGGAESVAGSLCDVISLFGNSICTRDGNGSSSDNSGGGGGGDRSGGGGSCSDAYATEGRHEVHRQRRRLRFDVARLGPGDFFGEGCVLDCSKCTYTAVATAAAATEVFIFNSAEARRLLTPDDVSAVAEATARLYQPPGAAEAFLLEAAQRRAAYRRLKLESLGPRFLAHVERCREWERRRMPPQRWDLVTGGGAGNDVGGGGGAVGGGGKGGGSISGRGGGRSVSGGDGGRNIYVSGGRAGATSVCGESSILGERNIGGGCSIVRSIVAGSRKNGGRVGGGGGKSAVAWSICSGTSLPPGEPPLGAAALLATPRSLRCGVSVDLPAVRLRESVADGHPHRRRKPLPPPPLFMDISVLDQPSSLVAVGETEGGDVRGGGGADADGSDKDSWQEFGRPSEGSRMATLVV